jgi:hypothetical protein
MLLVQHQYFTIHRNTTITASIIDIVPSAVNQEKTTGELTCNLNFILIVAPVKSKLKMICLFLKVSPL